MSKLTRDAYERLIAEDIAELHKLPHTLERAHIEEILKWSIITEYEPETAAMMREAEGRS